MKDAKLDIRIPADLKHKLGMEAASDDRSMSQVVIIALKQYLSRKDKK